MVEGSCRRSGRGRRIRVGGCDVSFCKMNLLVTATQKSALAEELQWRTQSKAQNLHHSCEGKAGLRFTELEEDAISGTQKRRR